MRNYVLIVRCFILLVFVLLICLILHGCKSCKKETVTLEIDGLSETLYVGEQVDLTYNSSKETYKINQINIRY